MARARIIKPAFFKNDVLAECDPMARLLFIGLWTLADRDGRIECRPVRLKAEIFPYENCDIDDLIGQLQSRGFVSVYESNAINVLQITKFCEHQRCHPQEKGSGLPEPDENSKTIVFPGKNALPEKNTAKSEQDTTEPEKKLANCAFNPLILQSSNPSNAQSKPTKRRSCSEPKDAITWDIENGWQGITDADRQEWATAYPAADLTVELAKATQWLKANPKKAKKSNWRRWLTTVWLSRCQDSGGTHRQPGNRPDDKPAPERWLDQYRPAEYKRPRQAVAEADAVAKACRVTD
jgi:hypothetical protein